MFKKKDNSKKRFLLGVIIGISFTLLFFYNNPSITAIAIQSSQKLSHNVIKDLFNSKYTNLNNLVVNAVKDTIGDGTEFSNGTESVFIYPQRKQATNISIILSYMDSNNDRKFLLYSKIDSEIPKLYSYFEKEIHPSDYSNNIPISNILTDYQENNKAENFDPIKVKDYIELQNLTYDNSMDYNSIDTVLKLTKNVFGSNENITINKIFEIFTSDNYAYANEINSHKKISHYLIDLGKLENQPELSLNSQLKNTKILWVNAQDIQLSKNINNIYSAFDQEIDKYHLPILNEAIKLIRDKDLASLSRGLISSHKSLMTFLTHFKVYNDLEHINEFGHQANLAYNKDKCIAQNIGNAFVISRKYLQLFYEECNLNQ